ncbi:MAG: NAD(P)-binding domain-containing protein [Bacteroidales bacterium]|nr:NAD(P)-binding domain-containing protein [Bacteroidales bacterium]
MEAKKVGFIGGGRVTRIILKAWQNRLLLPDNISVFDINSDVTGTLKGEFPSITVCDDPVTVAGQDVIFIALHPPVIPETLEKIAGVIPKESVIISLAPKISIEKIALKINSGNVVRMIPNATSYVNKGYNPVCFAPGFQSGLKQSVMEMLAPLGHTFEVSEHKLEAYAILSAMLPTYFWFQWVELGKLGPQMGLTEEETAWSIRESMIAAIEIMYDSGLKPEQVIDLIPVKPIGTAEKQISEVYHTLLPALFEKIKP